MPTVMFVISFYVTLRIYIYMCVSKTRILCRQVNGFLKGGCGKSWKYKLCSERNIMGLLFFNN